MNFTIKDFKVGQKWKTRNGKIATITELVDGVAYPVRGEIDKLYRSWESQGREESNYTCGNDLIELVSAPTCEMNKHPNCEFIVAFAEGQQVQSKLHNRTEWVDVEFLCEFVGDTKTTYRVKPKTRIINGFEVPVPMDKTPEMGAKFYTVKLGSSCLFGYGYWQSNNFDELLFSRGLCFHCRDDAIKTAKAMLGVDPNA